MNFYKNSTVNKKYEEAEFILGDPLHAFDTDGFPTFTSREQLDVEQSILCEVEKFNTNKEAKDSLESKLQLVRHTHILYVLRSLRQLGRGYVSMDASRTWFAYWGLHSLRLLGHRLDDELTKRLIDFLRSCEAPSGGYGGAPGHLAHLATTYAAVMALVSVGTADALAVIDRVKLRAFLLSMRRPDGSFSMHEGGEADVRGVYCAVAVASITHLSFDRLFDNTAAWILSCQSYEGGFGGEPNGEAHGGYTYCAATSLVLLNETHLVDGRRVLDWLVKRQMPFEGGFNGRANKLVDGCYSFWQAAAFHSAACAIVPITTSSIRDEDDFTADLVSDLFDVKALQQYVLVACQDRVNGGLRDKPAKQSDLYHTCYCLSGLSIAQTFQQEEMLEPIVGDEANCLMKLHPLYNVCEDQMIFSSGFFNLLAERDGNAPVGRGAELKNSS